MNYYTCEKKWYFTYNYKIIKVPTGTSSGQVQPRCCASYNQPVWLSPSKTHKSNLCPSGWLKFSFTNIKLWPSIYCQSPNSWLKDALGNLNFTSLPRCLLQWRKSNQLWFHSLQGTLCWPALHYANYWAGLNKRFQHLITPQLPFIRQKIWTPFS